jgi:acyl carrier protein
MMEIEIQIKQFVLDNFLFGGSLDDIDAGASLINTGIIDSLGVMELIAFSEETYGIEVADAEVVPQNFDSVRNLATYIQAKLNVSTAMPA